MTEPPLAEAVMDWMALLMLSTRLYSSGKRSVSWGMTARGQRDPHIEYIELTSIEDALENLVGQDAEELRFHVRRGWDNHASVRTCSRILLSVSWSPAEVEPVAVMHE